MKKTLLFSALALLLFACSSPDDSFQPKPAIFTKAVTMIYSATNIKINSAMVVAKILPNEDDAHAAFQMKENSKTNWSTYSLISTYSGKDTIKVTFDFYDLKANTKYDFRIKVVNKAGESVSEIATFETYAVTDFDGNYYHTVTIGTQVWLRENFKGTHFANGDPIPNITDQVQWEASTSSAYCYYNNDIKNADTYGALYNWYTASDSRELIAGFHTPSEAEFRTIANYLGGQSVAGGAMKEAGFAHWVQPNKGATNSSGFTGLPAGVRQGKFSNLGDGGIFWTKDRFFGLSDQGYVFDLGEVWSQLGSGGCYNWQGLSLRLIKN